MTTGAPAGPDPNRYRRAKTVIHRNCTSDKPHARHDWHELRAGMHSLVHCAGVPHLTNPHDPPAPSGYTPADFAVGDYVWVTLEPEPCVITGIEIWGTPEAPARAFATRAADGVELNPVTAEMMSPAPIDWRIGQLVIRADDDAGVPLVGEIQDVTDRGTPAELLHVAWGSSAQRAAGITIPQCHDELQPWQPHGAESGRAARARLGYRSPLTPERLADLEDRDAEAAGEQ